MAFSEEFNDDHLTFGKQPQSWVSQLMSPTYYREGSANLPLPFPYYGENVVMNAAGWGDG